MGWIANLLGGGVVSSIERIATEWIETDKESAEAKAVMVKALDKNGNMRVQISKDVTQMYKVYIYLTVLLLLAQAFDIGSNPKSIKLAVENLVELFFPITTLFGAIVTASFGVNGINSHREKKA